MIKYIALLFSLMFVASSCEKLEDTYKDYVGDGEIRYLGQCSNVSVSPGWKRLIVKWVNGVDPMIDKVKVTWKVNDKENTILLDKGKNEYSIPNLGDGIYTISVCSVDKNGKSSLESIAYGRPYTSSHELIQSFTRIISKYYILNDHLILYFIGWQDNINSAILKYTKMDGTIDSLVIKKRIVRKDYYMLPEKIDVSKPITLYRTGYVTGCEDLITFDPYVLSRDKTYSADFKEMLKTKYGTSSGVINASGDVSETWANNVSELDFDISLTSFDDILNFPKLKKLNLGKHRYLLGNAINDQRGQLSVTDRWSSEFALEKSNKLTGLIVDRYNKHFKNISEPFIREMGKPVIPDYNYLNLNNLKFSLIPADSYDYNSHLEFLTDGNLESCWQSITSQSATEYSLVLDLKTIKHLSGLKIVQKHFGAYDQNMDIMPNLIKIKLSDNLATWEDATYVEENIIGTSSGEVNIIPFMSGGKNARYVKVIVNSQFYQGFYNVALAEIGLF